MSSRASKRLNTAKRNEIQLKMLNQLERSTTYPLYKLYQRHGDGLSAHFTKWHYLYFIGRQLDAFPMVRKLLKEVLAKPRVGMVLYVNGKFLRKHYLRNNRLDIRVTARRTPTPQP